jgi:hypothetical protein
MSLKGVDIIDLMTDLVPKVQAVLLNDKVLNETPAHKEAIVARNTERVRLIFDLLAQREKLPPELWMELLKTQELTWTTNMKRVWRASLVCAELDANGWTGEQYKRVSEKLIGTPAYASESGVKASYDWVQKHAAPGWARKRTYRNKEKSL